MQEECKENVGPEAVVETDGVGEGREQWGGVGEVREQWGGVGEVREQWGGDLRSLQSPTPGGLSRRDSISSQLFSPLRCHKHQSEISSWIC